MAASPGLQDSNPWVDLAPEIREAESVLLSVRDQLRDELRGKRPKTNRFANSRCRLKRQQAMRRKRTLKNRERPLSTRNLKTAAWIWR